MSRNIKNHLPFALGLTDPVMKVLIALETFGSASATVFISASSANILVSIQ
jgi:hypothetical protein